MSTDNIDVIESSEWAFTEENDTAYIHVDSYIFIYTRSIKLPEVFADTVVVDLLGDNYGDNFALSESLYKKTTCSNVQMPIIMIHPYIRHSPSKQFLKLLVFSEMRH